MKTPENLFKEILKNPWFLWFMLLIGVNPVQSLERILDASSDQASRVVDIQRY